MNEEHLIQETDPSIGKKIQTLTNLRRQPFKRKHLVPGRNDKCTCGSGKKFKHCCEIRKRLQLQAFVIKRREEMNKTK